jgi:hypothetical protein
MLSKTAELLRNAVAAGDYREMDRLLDVYRSEVEARWKESQSAEERCSISTEVTTLLGWARQTILAARAHTQRKLIHLTRQSAYVSSSSPSFDQI